MGYVDEAAVCEDSANGLTVGTGTALECVNDGEGSFAFTEIRGGGLAENLVVRGQVQDVVNDLESEAEVAAIFAERIFEDAHRRGRWGSR